MTFTDTYTLRIGHQTLNLAYRGDDHEPGNIYIYAPKQKVLMKVDIVFPGWAGISPSRRMCRATSRHRIQILSYDFDSLVSGHFGRMATRKDVEVQEVYLQDIVANAQTALKTVDFMAIASKTGFDNLALLFETYLGAVSQEMRRPNDPCLSRPSRRRRHVDEIALRPRRRSASDQLTPGKLFQIGRKAS